MSNSLGEIFRITIFGESHGTAIGIVIEGCPAGLELRQQEIQKAVDRRKPQGDAGQTARHEADEVEILSGVFDGYTTGMSLAMLVRNRDIDSKVYQKMRYTPRPGHADYTAWVKYNGFNDFRGGGAFSGRVTVALVMAGAVAAKLLSTLGIETMAYTVQIANILSKPKTINVIRKNIDQNALRCGDVVAAKKMQAEIEKAAKAGDSLGGIIECQALNVPAGLGEPYFDTLEGQLAKAFFAIPAVKGVEFGSGFWSAGITGSQNNDPFIIIDNKVGTSTNHAGGILGGISNGSPIVARIAVKPVPSIAVSQTTIDLRTMKECEITIVGRHDSCIVPRAAVVAEAMMAVTLCDFALRAGFLKRTMK
jgi:chorismate synthase